MTSISRTPIFIQNKVYCPSIFLTFSLSKKNATSTASAVGTVNTAFEDGKVTQKDLTSAVKGQLYYVESNLKAGIFGKEAVKLTSAEVS